VSNNEDFRVEMACLNRFQAPANSLRAACVTGGADTTLSALIHPSVGHVTSYDPSPLQIHLLHLKVAVAVSDLSASQAAGFLLRGEGGRKVFDEKLAKDLPKESLEFFQAGGAGEDEIDKGILRAENDGPFNKMLRKWFADEHSIDLSGFHGMSAAEKDQVLSICATADGKALTVALQTFFKTAPWFKAMAEENQKIVLGALSLASHSTIRGTGKILSDIDQNILPRDEFHTDIVLSGSPKTLPPWLTDRGRCAVRAKSGQLKTVIGKAEDLKDMDRFDFISLSNIYDFGTEESAIASVKGVVASVLKPNGEMLVRRAVGNADSIMTQAGGKRMEGEALENYDYNSLFYRNAGTVASAKFA